MKSENTKTRDLYIGIDPGLDGAVAVIDDRGFLVSLDDAPTISVEKPAKKNAKLDKDGKKKKGKKRLPLASEMADIIERARTSTTGRISVTIENVHAMPKQGVTSMFSMGRGFGIWEGIVSGLRLPVEYVEPSKWKREMGILRGSDKAASIVAASRLFPGASLSRKKDDGRGDALLIAEHARRKRVGSNKIAPKS